ncbi:MAG: DNA cytosine methyltransferase, partial [Acutalibacteraceae bacterium]
MKNKNLTLGSLFDGSGGFPLGGLLAGIEPVWASEIAPFPIRVTTKRLPQMKHCGDVSKLNGAELPPVDVVTFGSPCQDLSLAGKRYGLSGSRSNLFYEAVRIVKEMRCATNGKYPRFIVWENVPGAFSSNKGQDFRAVLDAICKVKRKDYAVPEPPSGKWTNAGCIVGENFSLAWRVFDAQYWGVPQRRKRIFLVADFAEQCAGKILFESEGVSGYSPKSVCPWQGTSESTEKSTGKTGISIDGYNGSVSNQVSTLGVNCGMSTGRNGVMVLNDQGGNRMDLTENKTCTLRAEAHHPPLVFENHSQDTRYTQLDNIAPTVLSTYGTGGNNQPFVLETPKTLKIRSGCEGGGKGALIQNDKSATLSCNNDQTLFVPKCYGICSKNSNSMKSDNPNSGFYEAQTSRCIDANGGNPSCNQGGMAVVAVQGSVIGRKDKNGPQGSGIDENVSFTLNTVDKHAVAYGIDRAAFNQGKNAKFGICIEEEIEPPIVAR